MSWIQTYTGKKFSLVNPQPEDVCIEDISHALSIINRFNGHTVVPLSVAQHSIIISQNVQSEFALLGLMHDATEAYIGDIARPLKHWLGDKLKAVERNVEQAIFSRFGLKWTQEAKRDIHRADVESLANEASQLMKNGIHPDWEWPDNTAPIFHQNTLTVFTGPEIAKRAFLKRFNELTTKKVT